MGTSRPHPRSTPPPWTGRRTEEAGGVGSLTGVRLPARPDTRHSLDSPHGPSAWGEGGLGRSHRGAAPPGGSQWAMHGAFHSKPRASFPRQGPQPDRPSPAATVVSAPGRGPLSLGLTSTYCGVGAWASGPPATTMGLLLNNWGVSRLPSCFPATLEKGRGPSTPAPVRQTSCV